MTRPRCAMGNDCEYPLEVLDFLPFQEKNRSILEENFPCELRVFWVEDLRSFAALVRLLLKYISPIIILFGLFFNSIAFLVLNLPPINTTSLSVYLRALAISDNGALILSYGVGILRGHFTTFDDFYMENIWACEIHKVTAEMFFLISAWLVVALTVERWLVIRCPFGIGYNCNTRSAECIVIILGICLLPVALSKIWFAGIEQDSVFGHHSCFLFENGWDKAVYLYVAAVLWIPLLLISIGNLGILCEIWYSARKRSQLVAPEFEHDGASETQKLTCLLLLLSATYLLLLMPLAVVETMELYWDGRMVTPRDEFYLSWMKTKLTLKWIRGLCLFLYQWNFAFNFFLYCLSGDKFRCAVSNWFDKCMSCRRKKKNKFKGFPYRKTSPSIIIISRTASVSSGLLLSEA